MATTRKATGTTATKTSVKNPTVTKGNTPTLIHTATGTARWDHKNCTHAHSGAEGKKARAACRKEHESELKKAREADAKKAARAAAPKPAAKARVAARPAPRPAPVAAAAPVPATVEVEDISVDA